MEQIETFLADRFFFLRLTTDDDKQGKGERTFWSFPLGTAVGVQLAACTQKWVCRNISERMALHAPRWSNRCPNSRKATFRFPELEASGWS